MADIPLGTLAFRGTCPDCGERRVDLPPPLPEIGDDFDWHVRDFDGFRRFMLQELAARFPERRRWTPADMEVVLVESLSAVLDQLSDMVDRVASEANLETARRPESVRRLLKFIGYDAVKAALARNDIFEENGDSEETLELKLEQFWLSNPFAMDAARQAGPWAVHTQYRMVTLEDYAKGLERHPLVMRAHAWSGWNGSWTIIQVATINWENVPLDERPPNFYPKKLKERIFEFHREYGVPEPRWEDASPPNIRTILRLYLDGFRMAGQEVILRNTEPVPISMAFSIRVAPNYFQSEIRNAITQALGNDPGGFFEPGRLRFGEDLHVSDILEVLMALDGIENACVNRFKRLGSQFADQSDFGTIVLEGLEIAVCDNDPTKLKRGYYRLTLQGGAKG